jgi:hypothetical protein
VASSRRVDEESTRRLGDELSPSAGSRDIPPSRGSGVLGEPYPGRLERLADLLESLYWRSRRGSRRAKARSNGDQYASRVGFREERVARNEVAAREINEAIEESDTRPASTFIHVLCECGVEDCARVLAITRPVYERVRNDPRQFVILPPHLISEIEDVVLESDGFLIVAKRKGTPEDLAVRTDPRR